MRDKWRAPRAVVKTPVSGFRWTAAHTWAATCFAAWAGYLYNKDQEHKRRLAGYQRQLKRHELDDDD